MMAYVIDEKNLERQLLLAHILAPYTLQALQPVTLKRGSRILDIGCGLGETTGLLAAYFPGIEVTGVDQDAHLLETARSRNSPGSSVIHFMEGDADALSFADASFVLVFCRYVLVHLPDPLKALSEMKRVCKKGGVILVQEPDHGIMDSYPESFAYLKLKQFYHKLFPDPLIGRKLESYFKKLNLGDITMQAAIACETGEQHHIKRVFHLTGEAIGQALMNRQLLSEQEFDDFVDELARIEKDENTFLLSPLCLSATGRV